MMGETTRCVANRTGPDTRDSRGLFAGMKSFMRKMQAPDGTGSEPRRGPGARLLHRPDRGPAPIVLSFDVEEHHRIEAAAGLERRPGSQGTYRERMRADDPLAPRTARGVADHAPRSSSSARSPEHNPRAGPGHPSGRPRGGQPRLGPPAGPRDDPRGVPRGPAARARTPWSRSPGQAVARLPGADFSIVRQTAWALDVLAELGFLYDSSIYPVRHDRYGVPDAPRGPFLARGPDTRSWSSRRRRCARRGEPPGGRRRVLPAPAAPAHEELALGGVAPRSPCGADCPLFPSLGVRPRSAPAAAGAAQPVPDLCRDPPQPRSARRAAVRSSLHPRGRPRSRAQRAARSCLASVRLPESSSTDRRNSTGDAVASGVPNLPTDR